jgi:hypothetical protein
MFFQYYHINRVVAVVAVAVVGCFLLHRPLLSPDLSE